MGGEPSVPGPLLPGSRAPWQHRRVADERETLTYELFGTARRELAERVAADV
jgi:hypothetical protein